MEGSLLKDNFRYLSLTSSTITIFPLSTCILAPHGAQAFIAFSYSTTTTTLLYYSIFSKYSPKTSENQFLEEALTGLCVIAIPLTVIRHLSDSYDSY